MNGAGSIVATNFVTNVAPQDGSIIAGLQREIALVQLMGVKQAKYKAEQIQWLGSLAKEAGVCAVAKHSGITKFEDAYQKEYALGGTGKNATEFWPKFGGIFTGTTQGIFFLICIFKFCNS